MGQALYQFILHCDKFNKKNKDQIDHKSKVIDIYENETNRQLYNQANKYTDRKTDRPKKKESL